MDIKEEEILGGAVSRHWYYRSKANAMLRYIQTCSPHSVLDVGAGSGFFSREILMHTNAKEAICVDTGYAEEREEILVNKKIRFLRNVNKIEADLVLMMDVLEHVEDDIGLLQNYVSKVPSGTYFLITVPAYMFMWSEHDDYLQHKRRYTLAQLESALRNAGLDIVQGSYYYGLVLPLAYIERNLGKLLRGSDALSPRSNLKQHSKFVNSALSIMCKLELPLISFNRLVGLSVFSLSRKR